MVVIGRPRSAWRIVGLVLMAVSIVAVIVAITTDDEGWEAFGSVGLGAALALVGLQVLGLLTQAYRYWLTIDEAGTSPIPPMAWLRLFILGRFLNTLVPQAGNAYRGIQLKRRFGLSISRYLGAFLAFIWLSTLVNLVAALVVLLVAEPGLEFGSLPASLLTGALLLLAAAAPFGSLAVLRRIRLAPNSRAGWVYRRTTEMMEAIVLVARSKAALGRFVLAALLGLALWVGVFAIAFDSVASEASLSSVTLFYVLQQLGTYWNITPGNLGLQELYSGALAAQLGFGLVTGLVVAAIIRLTSFIALSALGLAFGGLGALRQVRRDQIAEQ